MCWFLVYEIALDDFTFGFHDHNIFILLVGQYVPWIGVECNFKISFHLFSINIYRRQYVYSKEIEKLVPPTNLLCKQFYSSIKDTTLFLVLKSNI